MFLWLQYQLCNSKFVIDLRFLCRYLCLFCIHTDLGLKSLEFGPSSKSRQLPWTFVICYGKGVLITFSTRAHHWSPSCTNWLQSTPSRPSCFSPIYRCSYLFLGLTNTLFLCVFFYPDFVRSSHCFHSCYLSVSFYSPLFNHFHNKFEDCKLESL